MTLPAEKIRLIVVFGGQSAERDISCLTAAHVLRSVDPERYEVHPVGIDKSGGFVSAESAALPGGNSEPAAGDTTSSEVKPLAPVGESLTISALLSSPTSCTQTVVLPLLHGPLGEDGTIQGLLEMLDVAYVGAGVLGSAVAMDKAMAKTILDAHGIPQTAWLSFSEQAEPIAAMVDQAVEAVGLPCFVKPANMGSSIGITKADTPGQLTEAFATAFRYDEVVVVEEAVTAREIEFAVLGNSELRISMPGEIKPAADFYDYEDKYFNGAAELEIPAVIDPAAVSEMQEIAMKTYRALRIEGMARADFLYEEGGRGPLMNELNTIPGFTPISMYPKLWQQEGLSYSELINELVSLAVDRHQRRSSKRAAS